MENEELMNELEELSKTVTGLSELVNQLLVQVNGHENIMRKFKMTKA